MTKANRSVAGKVSRDRGKRFERRCAKLLPQILDHEHWKRTQRGDKQHYGDLVPCDAPMLTGKERTDLMPDYHIECKFRANYTIRDVRRWIDDTVKAGGYTRNTILMVGRAGGPVFVMWCDRVKSDQAAFPESYIKCYMVGETRETGGGE